MIKKIIFILNKFKKPIDVVFFFILIAVSIIFLIYRKIGTHKLTISRNIFKLIGVYPIIDHYYEPQFNFDSLSKDLSKDRNLKVLILI